MRTISPLTFLGVFFGCFLAMSFAVNQPGEPFEFARVAGGTAGLVGAILLATAPEKPRRP